MATSAPSRPRNGSWLELAVFGGVGIACALSVMLAQYPRTTHVDTAEIHMLSTLGFVLNTGKHPPLLPWLVHAVDLIVPIGRNGLMVLAFANMMIGVYAVWRVARLVVGVERAALAVALLGLNPYSMWLAMKFNHNAILMSLWPLCIWAFLACLRRPTMARGALLGVAAAAGVLAKYYVLLLLAALLLISLVWRGRAAFWRAPGPWTALAVFAALLAPHVYVTYIADGRALATLFHDTAFERLNPLVHALEPTEAVHVTPWRMLRGNLLALMPMGLGLAALAWAQRGRWVAGGLPKPVARPGREDHTWMIATTVAMPLAATVVIAYAFALPATANWTSPVFTVLPVLLAGFLSAPSQRLRVILARVAALAGVAMIAAGPLVLYANFKNGSRWVVSPLAEAADEAAAVWQASIGTRAAILMGNQALANTGSLELPWRPLSWPAFNRAGAPFSQAMVDQAGFVGFCLDREKICNAQALVIIRDSGGFACRVSHRRTHWGLIGPEQVTHVYIVPPKGSRQTRETATRACRDVIIAPE